ncbi:unnamed protein product [Peniophora sp. CBMAI 1063]|nr:unnamed protein product [Peniophora sp. CBMAI 1063]
MPVSVRSQDLGVRTQIDRWLEANENPLPRLDASLLITHIMPETVDVRIEMISQQARHPLDVRDPFEVTPSFVALIISVHFPTSASLPPRLLNSPPGLLETWKGKRLEPDAPRWAHRMQVGDVQRFSQPRSTVPDFFAELAKSYMNISEGYSPAMLRWASDVAAVRSARREVMQSPFEVENRSIPLRRSSRFIESRVIPSKRAPAL